MKFKELIAKGESKTLELKERLPSNVKIAKTVIAFANTSGGMLIIGIKDNLEIQGLDENISRGRFADDYRQWRTITGERGRFTREY